MGGWITDSYSWPWIFFINIPIGIFAVMVVRQQLKARPVVITRQPMDYVGLITLIIGVGALQIVLDKGNDLDWFESNFILLGTALSVVALAAFVALRFELGWNITPLLASTALVTAVVGFALQEKGSIGKSLIIKP